MASDDRVVGHIFHSVSKDQLQPGDHIYAWRNNVYTHHGIYTGEEGKIVIHSSADPRKSQSESKSSATIRSITVEEFCDGSKLRLAPYGVPRGTAKAWGTCYSASCVPPDEVVKTAEKYLEKPDEWGVYHALDNNCEHFAFHCKTGTHKYNGQAEFLKIFGISSIPGKNLFMHTSITH